MVLKLYGSSLSPPTQTVAIVLIETGVPFEFINVDFLLYQHKTPEYLEKNPFGQIPCIDDDGFILYESRVISNYIVAKYGDRGTKLVPTDVKARALFEQAVFTEQNHFHPHAFAAVTENVFKTYRGGIPDKAVFDAHIKTLDGKLDVYEKILSKQKCIAGDELTLADLFHIPYGHMLSVAGSDIMQSKPNVARWFKELTSRPSWVSIGDGITSTV